MLQGNSTTKPQRMTRLTRVQRAERLVAWGHVHPDPAGRGRRYWVDSDRGNTKYRVELSKTTAHCQCFDWQRQYEQTGRPDAHCKHALSVVLYKQAVRDAFRPHREVA